MANLSNLAGSHMKPKCFGLILLFSLAMAHCSPSDSEGTGRSRTDNQLGSQQQPGAQATGETAGPNCSGEDCNASGSSGYESMPIGELTLLEQERKNQDLAEEDELFLLDAINNEFCRKLEEKRQNCPAIKRLIFDPSERSLKCDGQSTTVDTAPKIEVTIPNTKSGSFVLVANDLYRSSPFSSGTSEITFSSESGGELQAPAFIKVYKLVLRSYNDANELLPLPSIDAFNVRITIDGKELLDDYAGFSEDTLLREANTEYSIPVNDIINLRKSTTCLVDQNQINAIRTQITQVVTADQVNARKEDYKRSKAELEENIANPTESRGRLIDSIYKHEASIEYRFPLLEAERNRQFKLASELKTDVQIGCQFGQPINSFELELEGSMNDNVFLGVEEYERPDDIQDGTAQELLFDFGGVTFTVDFSTQNIFGIRYPLEKDVSDQAIIGELDRIYIRKKATTFSILEESCNKNGGIGGQIEKLVYDKTCYRTHENGVFAIDSITIYVNGLKAFSRSGLGISLNREQKKWDTVLQSNEKWVQLMLDDTCETIN